MVEHVGEARTRLEMDALGDRELLRQSGRQIDYAGTDDVADVRGAKSSDGIRRSRACADVARGARRPTRDAGARECRHVDPIACALIRRNEIHAGDAIGILVAAVDRTGAGAGGVAAVEIRRNERTALDEENIREAPTAENCVHSAAPVVAERAALTEWQIVESGGDPAMTARAVDFAVIEAAIVEEGCARAAVFVGEGLLMRLVVGGVFRERVGGVE